MRNNIVSLFFTLLAVVPFLGAARMDDRVDPWTAPYDKRAEIRLEGMIKGVGIEPTPLGHWTYITVAREDEWFKVYLGPRDFVMQYRLLPLLDTKVTITGTLFEERRRILIARVLRVPDAVIILRDRDGTPRWDKPGPVEMDPVVRPKPAAEDAVEIRNNSGDGPPTVGAVARAPAIQ